jgi:carboxylesterase
MVRMKAMSTTESLQSHTHVLRQPAIGALLIHGLNGTQEEMAEMETFLQAKGLITENILLPGHGVPVREMASLGWEDWADAVCHALHLLKQRCEYVFLVGHSLGGALALHVAAHEEVTGIVTMCAPLHMYPGLKRLVGIVRRITPLLPMLHDDVRDPGARRRYKRNVYRLAPVAPVYSMLQFLPQLREELPGITVPALIMIATNDHVVPARDGREIYRLIGSHEKHLLTFHHSYHMIMMDHEREEVFAKTSAFILRHAGKVQSHSRG